MRSPVALVASLACLASAALMAGFLVQDEAPAEPLAAEGEEVHVSGALDTFSAPKASSWDHIEASLWGTTYRLEGEGVSGLVLLTGLDEGWDGTFVHADAIVILHTDHPAGEGTVTVLSARAPPSIG